MKYYHMEMGYSVDNTDEYDDQYDEFMYEYRSSEIYPEDEDSLIPSSFYFITEEDLIIIRLKYSLSEKFLRIVSGPI